MVQAPGDPYFTGYGKYVHPNNDSYVGGWVLGKMHGHGTLKNPNDDVYEGSFENNLMHGYGKMILKKPDG